jgi:glucosamine--fructose-6-phosphate aminotransferase (isomerizing)
MVKMWTEITESAAGCRAAREAGLETVKALASALRKKKVKSVVIAARGTSDHAGIYAKYLIETYVGLPVSLAAPSVYTVYEGKLSLKDSFVIGISQSGRAADANEVLARGRADGAVTLAITNNADSLMASTAEYHLNCSAGPEVSVAATKTFVTQLYLSALLVAEWSRNSELKKVLRAVPGVLEKTYKLEDVIGQAARRYCFATDGFILGRGFAYPIAMEFALKTQETCYVRTRGYATSDFYHGPIAMISDNTPTFLFAVEENLYEDAEKMAEKLHEKGADVFAFTTSTNLLTKVNDGVLLPGKNGVEALFAAVAAMQIFACKLSLAKGLNPDAPRGLSKVTITK